MNRLENLTSTQRGKIAELHVATALMAQSGGRLSPFEPMSDDHGIDLVVIDKATGRAMPIQVKSWLLSPDRPVKNVQFDVRKATFSEMKGGVIIAVVMDPDTLAMTVAWLVPLRDLPTLATEQPTKFVMAPSRMEGSTDRYVGHRHTNIASLTQALQALMAE